MTQGGFSTTGLLTALAVILTVSIVGMTILFADEIVVTMEMSEEKTKLVCLGDSIGTNYKLKVRSNTFSDLLGRRLGLEVCNYSTPAITAGMILERLYKEEKMIQDVKDAMVIVIAVGSNNLLRGTMQLIVEAAGIEQSMRMVNKIVDAGHELGNHSDTHKDPTTLDADALKKEIEHASGRIEEICGIRPVLYRPPSGAYNDLVVDTARDLGYQVIQWSVDSLDWKGLSAAEMERRVCENLTYGDILLFHNDTPHTAEALPSILSSVLSMGYTFVPVGELVSFEQCVIDHTGRQFVNRSLSCQEDETVLQ